MKFYTTKEAAEILNVNDSRVRQLILSGELQGKKLGRHMWMITEKDIKKFLKRKAGRV